MDPITMSRLRLGEEEVQEVKRGLLLRMRGLLEERRDLRAAGVVYSLFIRSLVRRVGLIRSRLIGISSSI